MFPRLRPSETSTRNILPLIAARNASGLHQDIRSDAPGRLETELAPSPKRTPVLPLELIRKVACLLADEKLSKTLLNLCLTLLYRELDLTRNDKLLYRDESRLAFMQDELEMNKFGRTTRLKIDSAELVTFGVDAFVDLLDKMTSLERLDFRLHEADWSSPEQIAAARAGSIDYSYGLLVEAFSRTDRQNVTTLGLEFLPGKYPHLVGRSILLSISSYPCGTFQQMAAPPACSTRVEITMAGARSWTVDQHRVIKCIGKHARSLPDDIGLLGIWTLYIVSNIIHRNRLFFPELGPKLRTMSLESRIFPVFSDADFQFENGDWLFSGLRVLPNFMGSRLYTP